MPVPPQALSVKRAQVEFHSFASFGEPERVLRIYAEENVRRANIIRKHREFIGAMSPFLEIGANAGHSSYMLANDFGADGFALDLSADALRHGKALIDAWRLERAPVRIAGDAVRLPFQDSSLRLVVAFQMLSQFMDIESVFVEVKRVLAPGGIFLFAEEPLRRRLSLRLYRAPYVERMKPWERTLHRWGLLGYLARDPIGAEQEESFGIRQNHTLELRDWDRLVRRHFVEHRYEIFVPEQGWGERVAKRVAVRLDPHRSTWRAARLLGGTLAAVCRKEGQPTAPVLVPAEFEVLLRCPDCGASLRRDHLDVLRCQRCPYQAANEDGVYTLLPSAERAELYPGSRADLIEFASPGHEDNLLEGWHQVEGVFGNKYRWMGPRATARLARVRSGAQRLRIRGHAPEEVFRNRGPVRIRVNVNGAAGGSWTLGRTGLFVLETDVPDAPEYHVEILAEPAWIPPGDGRTLTVTISMIRLVPAE